MLEGKAKELFWKWYLLPEQRKLYELNSLIGDNVENRIKFHFIVLSDSEKWGVYQDFADSLGYELHIEKEGLSNTFFGFVWNEKTKIRVDFSEIKTRPEARIGAIEKLNELINN